VSQSEPTRVSKLKPEMNCLAGDSSFARTFVPARTIVQGEFHNQGDNVKNEYYYLIVTQTTKYAQQAANLRAADRPLAARRAYRYDPLAAP
jgi:hypothetical protein